MQKVEKVDKVDEIKKCAAERTFSVAFQGTYPRSTDGEGGVHEVEKVEKPHDFRSSSPIL